MPSRVRTVQAIARPIGDRLGEALVELEQEAIVAFADELVRGARERQPKGLGIGSDARRRSMLDRARQHTERKRPTDADEGEPRMARIAQRQLGRRVLAPRRHDDRNRHRRRPGEEIGSRPPPAAPRRDCSRRPPAPPSPAPIGAAAHAATSNPTTKADEQPKASQPRTHSSTRIDSLQTAGPHGVNAGQLDQ